MSSRYATPAAWLGYLAFTLTFPLVYFSVISFSALNLADPSASSAVALGACAVAAVAWYRGIQHFGRAINRSDLLNR